MTLRYHYQHGNNAILHGHQYKLPHHHKLKTAMSFVKMAKQGKRRKNELYLTQCYHSNGWNTCLPASSSIYKRKTLKDPASWFWYVMFNCIDRPVPLLATWICHGHGHPYTSDQAGKEYKLNAGMQLFKLLLGIRVHVNKCKLCTRDRMIRPGKMASGSCGLRKNMKHLKSSTISMQESHDHWQLVAGLWLVSVVC